MDKTVDYYFSTTSPWTFLGHARFVALAGRHGATVNVKPIDLGGSIFPVTGGLPVHKRPKSRQAYRLLELNRWSAHLDLPLNVQPRFFPVAATPAARMIVAAELAHGAAAALELTGRVLAAVWTEERDIADADTLADLAAAAGLDAATLTARAGLEEVDRRYQTNTEEALARGVFGAPSYLYRDELFWGQDRLDFLDRALAAA